MSIYAPGTSGTIDFILNAGRNRVYILLGNISGITPGMSLPGEITTFPLNWDPFTDIVLSFLNSPVFTDFLRKLDGQGSAEAQINAPSLPPSAVGIEMHYAYCLNSPFDFASNPLKIGIVP